jgi:hypothetical protein
VVLDLQSVDVSSIGEISTYPPGSTTSGGFYIQLSLNSWNYYNSSVVTCQAIYNTSELHFTDFVCYDSWVGNDMSNWCTLADQSDIIFYETLQDNDQTDLTKYAFKLHL